MSEYQKVPAQIGKTIETDPGSARLSSVRPSFGFPFPPYDIQLRLMRTMYDAIEQRRVAILESPTGTGKSLSAICASLSWLEEDERRGREQCEQKTEQLAKRIRNASTDQDWMKAHKLKLEAEIELEELEEQKQQRLRVEQKLELIRQRQRTISQQRRMDEGWPTGKRKHFEEGTKAQQQEEGQRNRQDGAECDEGDRDQDLIPSDSDVDGQQIDEERDKENEQPLLCRKVIYASRTHSQLEQFAQELAKTDFRPRVLTLGSRQMLCVNDAVRSLSVVGLINDRCNELLSGTNGGGEKRSRRGEDAEMTKGGKRTGGCEFAHADAIEDLCGAALVGNAAQSRTAGGDVRELYELGRHRRACPYFASRAALGLCQLVLVPYNILLHKSTRDAWRLDLRDNVLIVDEAHNLLQTLAAIHAVELSTGQLSLCSALIRDYLERFRKRLSPRNLRHIRQLLSLTVALHNLAISMAKEEDGGAEETVLTLTQFMAKLGSAADIDLFRLLDYLERSKLCRKLRDFRLRHCSRGHSQSIVTAKGTNEGVGHKSHGDRIGKTPVNKKTLIDRGKVGLENILASANGHGDTTTPTEAVPTETNSTPLYQLREFIEAITSRTDDARIVISRRPRPMATDSGNKFTDDVRLRFLLLNPATRLGDLVSEARALILLGGTMRPTDQLIDALQRVCSVPDDRIVQFACGHIIDDKQLIALQIGNGPNGASQPLNLQFSARCSPQALASVAQCLLTLLRSVPNGAVAFFPSYAFLAAFVHHLRASGQWEQLQSVKRVHVETKEAVETATTKNRAVQQKQPQTIWSAFCESARSQQGAVLFAVVGGKLSEGINFSDELGRCVLMVGLPYANRNSVELSERIRYLDLHICPGAGTRFYEQLCQQAINQAIGRAIRHRADFAAIILLDERYARDSIVAGLPGWIRQRLTRAVPLPEALRRLDNFFGAHNYEKAAKDE